MIPLVLAPDEARAYHDGTLTEIRRPVVTPRPIVFAGDEGRGDLAAWGYWDGDTWMALARGLPRPGTMGESIPCPLGAPGDLLFGQEVWRSWQEEGVDEDVGDDGLVTYMPWSQTYVAYSATPRVGYRPVPDKARITYLHETSPLASNPKLLGPWEPAETMPEWASRIRLVNRGVRVERADVWMWIAAVEVQK